MIENGFYKVKQSYIELIWALGGTYRDAKERPVFCCIEDRHTKDLFWAIPTSDLAHRTPEQIKKVKTWCALDARDPRWAYYYIGHTNRPALYRVSSCFPIIDQYVDGPYTSQGAHLVLQNKKDIEIIRKKLSRILFAESRNPNGFEQHISAIQEKMVEELQRK